MNKKFTAKGTFEVELKPVEQNKLGDVTFGRFSVKKKFQGDLEGASEVDMLSAISDNGSRAYVAIERVSGTLQGKSGTFLFMQKGVDSKDSQELTVTVIPGFGTGELVGLEGTMKINIVEKEHFYEFEYSL